MPIYWSTPIVKKGSTWNKIEYKLRQKGKCYCPDVDKSSPKLILKSKRILQDKDENVFEYEDGIEEDDGQNCRDIFQVEVEVANVM